MATKKNLTINHWLYGKHTITEPVLIELITSPMMARLKDIEQHGTLQLHKAYKKKNAFSRYDHSIGVFLLLRKFGAPIEEQLHGLLHDISHTVFSHVADFLFGNSRHTHNYQDSRLKKAFELQGISAILKKHGFSPKQIVDDKIFPLAERDLPALCADRLDYTLQDPWTEEFDKVDPKKLLEDLIVYRQEFIFANKQSAQKFAHLYEQHNIKNWCNPLQIAVYTLSADMLREALETKVISKDELYKTDTHVLKKLRASKNPTIKDLLKKIQTLSITVTTKNKADFWSTSKARVVDPPFLHNGKVIRLTSVNPAYKKRAAELKKRAKQGFYIKIS